MAKRLLIILLLIAMSAAAQMVATASPDTDAAAAQEDSAQFTPYRSGSPSTADASAARANFPDLLTRDDGREPQFVFPPDDRERLSPADPRVAWIVTYYNDLADAFVCSAAFIGPDTLLTAAHCVYDTEEGFGYAEVVDVFPGIDGVGPDGTPYEGANLPHGWHEASEWFVPTAWIDSGGDFSHDYALISLNERVGDDTGWMQAGVLTDESLASSELWATTIGYPGDKEPQGSQWLAVVPELDFFDQEFLETQLDQFQGQSGSPVFRRADDVIFGVISFEAANALGEFNVSRRINTAVAGFLQGVCEDAGCTVDLFFEGDGDVGQPSGPAPQPGGQDSAFDRVWSRTDLPVVQGNVARTWMWGPQPFTEVMQEPYAEAPGGTRDVIYYDKTRMEITTPNADSNSIWYVTNGLLVQELVSGRLQLGHDIYEQHQPAEINVAGDSDDPTGPTYATFAGLLNASPLGVGATVSQRVDRAGNITNDPSLGAQGVTAAHFVPETNHTVAGPFWDFMNSDGIVYENGQMVTSDLFVNPFYATGFPITEPYWAEVKILGTYRLTLIQVFERRVLTYTPGNPPGFLVEAGNVGQHYHRWRYEIIPGGEPPVPEPDPDPTPEPPPQDAVTFGGGTHVVGEDIPAGTYRSTGPSSGDSCYWERLSGFGGTLDEVIANAFADYRQVVEIKSSDAGFNSERCGQWTNDLSPITASPTSPFGDGIWIVGTDITPGTWRSETPTGGSCYWARLGGFSGELDDIIANELTESQQVVTINSGDIGFESSGCGSWTLVSSDDSQPPTGEVPAEGEVVWQADLSNQGSVTGPRGDTGEPTAEGYAITNQEDSFLQLLGDQIYSDTSFTVRARVNDGAPIGLACVIARAQPSPSTEQLNAHAYHFCSVHERPANGGAATITGALAFYQNESTIEELGAWELDQSFPASQWHEVKLIARGSSLWFLLNGELLGTLDHGAVADGHPGFSAWNLTDLDSTAASGGLDRVITALAGGHGLQQAGGTSQIEFSELTVRALQ